MNYKSYEKYFDELVISEREANSLFDYMSSLAEIGIKFFNERKFEYYEKLCNMDEGVNQTSRG